MEVMYMSPEYDELDRVVENSLSVELVTRSGEVKVACLMP